MHQDLGTLVDHVWKAEDFVPIVLTIVLMQKKNIVLLQRIPALPKLLVVHLDDEHFGPPTALPKKNH